MASTEEKLLIILKSAGSKPYPSKSALARDVAASQFQEFSYSLKNQPQHCSPDAILQYVSVAQALGLLDDKLQPFADVTNAYLDGFKLVLSAKISSFSEEHRFNKSTLSTTVGRMIRKRPAQVPSLRNIYDSLQCKCGFAVFRRIVLMSTFIRDTGIRTTLRQVMLVPGTIEE